MDKNSIGIAGKFIAIGILSTCLNYLVFYTLLKHIHVNYISSSVIGYLTGLIFGFFLNNFWTFKAKQIILKQTIGYLFIYLLSLGLSVVFLWASVTKLHLDAFFMNIISIAISTISNFLGLKYFIYQQDATK